MKFKITSPIFSLLLIALYGCNSPQKIEVDSFEVFTNLKQKGTLKTISLDYQNAFKNGFVIPSINQVENGGIDFSFKLLNSANKPGSFFYKIYYQNESYKFPEGHEFDSENFYGTWENAEFGFKETEPIPGDKKFHTVNSSFKIIGNPRNEKVFYGDTAVGPISQQEIDKVVLEISSSTEWLENVKNKAIQNKYSIEKQLRLDAIYILKSRRHEGESNNRWKRNPRVGNYKFLLVVAQDSATINLLPEYIVNITKTDSNGKYINPFSFFKTNRIDGIYTYYSNNILKVSAKPDFKNGIYVNSSNFYIDNIDTSNFNSSCNYSEKQLYQSHFEQFVSSHVSDFTFSNVPIVADVAGNEYSRKDYQESLNKKHDFIKTPIAVTECPCKTIEIDINANKAILKNPSTKIGDWRKENVGIITRHGLTYGKYRAKIKFPPLLNKDLLWNGLTNAVWLIYQPGEWNKRRTCNKNGGYVPKSYPGNGDISRVPNDIYSEIDIEIVKASRNWPLSSYGGDASKKPKDPITDSNKVMVTYTNWDLACQDPEKFNHGVFNLEHNGNTNILHRWDSWYQAVTGKYGEFNDILFHSPYYWYEIEWRPDEIIWRIGPEKDKMIEIGYINSSVSSIPNNQMLLTITQEWHLENWWPEAPFNQNFIPFPAKEIVGEVLEVEIE
ncbi:MAG: hypothetical protein IT232_08685 [Flavobacteriales bacterium]|nr:hypothetical protein [Flavobacteriales bacterium]